MLATVLNGSSLVTAGVARLLTGFPHRAVLLDPGPTTLSTTDVVDVALYDTISRADENAMLDPQALRSLAPTARVVTLVVDGDPAALVEARQSGAGGAVHMSATGEEIVETLERVRDGEFVFPATHSAAEDDASEAGRWPGKEHGLTARESQMLSLICQRMSNQEICCRALLGMNTVKTYIRAAYRKVDVTTRSQAVICALTHGFPPEHATDRAPA